MTKFARLLVGALALALAAQTIAHAQDVQPSASIASDTRPVVIFAAASLKNALETIAEAWKTKTGKTATLSFAASSALAKQIESGAPADIFVSADLKWMDWSAERKLINDASRKNLLGNGLVLIAPKDSTSTLKIEKGFALAEALGDARLAMGQPDSVPAGIYGKTALTNLGVWDAIEPKVAGAENVRVALSYVSRGEAPLGIVYATDAKSDPGVKVVDTFPADSHPPIVYPVAVTAASTNPETSAFLEFLSTPDSAKVFEDAGFTVLK